MLKTLCLPDAQGASSYRSESRDRVAVKHPEIQLQAERDFATSLNRSTTMEDPGYIGSGQAAVWNAARSGSPIVVLVVDQSFTLGIVHAQRQQLGGR
jgi:hypothetical protein